MLSPNFSRPFLVCHLILASSLPTILASANAFSPSEYRAASSSASASASDRARRFRRSAWPRHPRLQSLGISSVAGACDDLSSMTSLASISCRGSANAGNGAVVACTTIYSLRGGGVSFATAMGDALASASSNPAALFDSLLAILSTVAIGMNAAGRLDRGASSGSGTRADRERAQTGKEEKPPAVRALQVKFLAAFWLLRFGYWMSGPYVVPAYKAKVFNGVEASMELVSRIFLTGFAATAMLGPAIGKATDRRGRKLGTLMFALLYGIGVASIRSDTLWVLFAGRAVVGCALSLLFTAPEAWLSSEASSSGMTKYIGETFGLAYTGDALVAVLAGKMASLAASARGISGPFDLSIVFLAAGGIVAGAFWKENRASSSVSSATASAKEPEGGIKVAFDIVMKDKRLILLGAVQSLFEAAMYVFILQWPPLLGGAIGNYFGEGAVAPFGTIFSCFMTSSLIGSMLFGKTIKAKKQTESIATGMLLVAAVSMGFAAALASRETAVPLWGVMVGFLTYEACVGMYFPAIGTLRSKYVPNENKSVILSLFGIPLNLLVVAIYLSIKQLGTTGALAVSAGALVIATGCMAKLRNVSPDGLVQP